MTVKNLSQYFLNKYHEMKNELLQKYKYFIFSFYLFSLIEMQCNIHYQIHCNYWNSCEGDQSKNM